MELPGFNINIVFNTDPSLTSSAQNFPTIILAQELIHEMVHAQMYRKLLSVLDIDTLDGDFPGMYDYYRRHKNWQHQQMAEFYRDVVKQALTEYDPSLTETQKEALSWIGLNSADIVAWQLKTSEGQEAINDLIEFIQNNW